MVPFVVGEGTENWSVTTVAGIPRQAWAVAVGNSLAGIGNHWGGTKTNQSARRGARAGQAVDGNAHNTPHR